MTTESGLIGESRAIKKLQREMQKVSSNKTHVLLQGERGTGKSTVAHHIHRLAKVSGDHLVISPFATSEMNFNEAIKNIPDNVSTVLIQEIEEFTFLHQSQIHKMIIGLPQKPFVRITVTLKKSLNELTREKRLVDGIAKTLKEFEILEIPTLHERSEDIPLLVEYFITNASENLGMAIKAIDINMLDFLVRRTWKENIRELKSVIEQAVFHSQGDEIELPSYLVDENTQLEGMIININKKKSFSFDKSLSNLEKTLIERTLETAGFNQSRAAEMLNLSEANLRYRLKKFHINQSRTSDTE